MDSQQRHPMSAGDALRLSIDAVPQTWKEAIEINKDTGEVCAACAIGAIAITHGYLNIGPLTLLVNASLVIAFISKYHQWMFDLKANCPVCKEEMSVFGIVFHHIGATNCAMHREQIADWLDTVDPTLPREAITQEHVVEQVSPC